MNKYRQLFIEVLELNEKEQKNIDSLEYKKSDKWDSLTQMRLLSCMEEEFGICFEREDIIALTSYQKGIDILKKYNVIL